MRSRSAELQAGSAEFERLRATIVKCRKCPRLVEYRESVEPRASFRSQDYWRKPVPGFGDINGRLLVLGLAPATHGGNRTGRPFTGDSSGRFLTRALYIAGFASQPNSESVDDGLFFRDCYLTAAVKCAPPGDKPLNEEFANCAPYLYDEIGILHNVQAVLALGALSFRSYRRHLRDKGMDVSGFHFAHGATFRPLRGPALYASYHPSPRNTNTGKLTQRMLVTVLLRIRRGFVDKHSSKA